MTVKEARLEMQKLLQTIYSHEEERVFPIFIDECFADEDSFYDHKEEFLMMRSLISAILCNPIFMGTNARSFTFIETFSGKISRTSSSNIPYCLLWYKLPDLDPEYMRQEKLTLRQTIQAWSIKKTRKFLSENFVDFLR